MDHLVLRQDALNSSKFEILGCVPGLAARAN